MSAEYSVNIHNCDLEPIGFINQIQPCGALVILNHELRLIQVSENVDSVLGLDRDRILDRHASIVFTPRKLEALKTVAGGADDRPVAYIGRTVLASGTAFNAFAHKSGDLLVVEFEPVSREADQELSLYSLRTILDNLSKQDTVESLANALAVTFKKLTGYDRVMIYKFHNDAHGEVIAESAEPDVDHYMHHHFPASDIPEPARRMFASNPTRLIADVHAKPVSLHPKHPLQTGEVVDLTRSALRQPSPIHIEYLKNMQVGGSLTVSLMWEGRLWGLIACHHREQKHLDYWFRSQCEFIGKLASSELDRVIAGDAQRSFAQIQKLGAMIAQKENLDNAFAAIKDKLREVFATSATVLTSENGVPSPASDDVSSELIKSLLSHSAVQAPLFQTDSISSSFPALSSSDSSHCGLLSMRMGNGYLLMFRPEYIETVTYGGNPNKSVEQDDSLVLHPRKSFAAWKEIMKGKSREWTNSDLLIASSVGTMLDEAYKPAVVQTRRSHKAALALAEHAIKSIETMIADDIADPELVQNLAMLKEQYSEVLTILRMREPERQSG